MSVYHQLLHLVEYQKPLSFAITYLYDVLVLIHYEMTESGKSEKTIRTDITPDNNKFIILRRNKGAFINED